MRLDHIAYRVKDRKKTAKFFIEAFGYKIQKEFIINFDNGETAECIALEPPEKNNNLIDLLQIESIPWTLFAHLNCNVLSKKSESSNVEQEYHLPPEIFVSDGSPDSIVNKWVMERNGIGGVHHIAYQVEDVEATMNLWKEKGYAEFATDKPLSCDDVIQVFSKPSELTGVIFEFIKRGEHGFCKDNVKALMQSSQDFK